MKKFFIFLFFVSVLNADIIVTEKQANGQGSALADVINMNYDKSYTEKISMCNEFASKRAMIGADNRKEMLHIVIKACQDSIKK